MRGRECVCVSDCVCVREEIRSDTGQKWHFKGFLKRGNCTAHNTNTRRGKDCGTNKIRCRIISVLQ